MTGLFDDLQWRRLVYQATDPEIGKLLDSDRLTFYVGFDPTAPSLHVGNMMQLCSLRRLALHGHRGIALIGGATGMIGDPGGKSEERNLLSDEDLDRFIAGISPQVERFVGASGTQIVNNADWFRKFNVLDFLRDVGKHFTVNQMVAKESVKTRFEGRDQAISYTEFSYMLLQAADYLHLFDTEGCRLQFGGSDQWGNITMGVELIRKVRGAHTYGLTSPLVLNADGTKMGKTAAGDAIWLDRNLTSPYLLYQHFIRSDDRAVGDYLRFFTWLERDRIIELDALTESAPERREAQRALAHEVVALVHGEHEAAQAAHASSVLYTEAVVGLDEQMLLDVFAEAPSTTMSRQALDGGVGLVDVLASSGLVPSKAKARDTISQGGAYINNKRVEPSGDPQITRADLLHDRYVILRRGKRDHHLLRFE